MSGCKVGDMNEVADSVLSGVSCSRAIYIPRERGNVSSGKTSSPGTLPIGGSS